MYTSASPRSLDVDLRGPGCLRNENTRGPLWQIISNMRSRRMLWYMRIHVCHPCDFIVNNSICKFLWTKPVLHKFCYTHAANRKSEMFSETVSNHEGIDNIVAAPYLEASYDARPLSSCARDNMKMYVWDGWSFGVIRLRQWVEWRKSWMTYWGIGLIYMRKKLVIFVKNSTACHMI